MLIFVIHNITTCTTDYCREGGDNCYLLFAESKDSTSLLNQEGFICV